MVKLVVIDRGGVERELEAEPGKSLMQVIRDAGFDELLALCGGCCSCCTCHVHVVNSSDLARLPSMSVDENDLLDGARTRDAHSRLSCQIPFTAELAGLTVRIAEAD